MGIFWLAAGPAASQVLPDDQILQNFDLVAFQNEFVEVPDPRIVKWTGPVNILVEEDVTIDNGARAFLDSHLRRLREATGLDMAYTMSLDFANFVIIFTRQANVRQYVARHAEIVSPDQRRILIAQAPRFNCVGFYAFDTAAHTIFRAIVIIPVDHAIEQELLTRCIAEETTQALGLPNDSDKVNPSVFNDSSALKDLSAEDVLMVRLLYDPRMAPGLPRDEALARAAQILPELRR